MKLVMDERVKHRLIGLAVILSIGAIFAPAIMKKSSQRIDGNVNVSVKLPAKPAQPHLDMAEKKAMFETVKVAHVDLPNVNSKQLPLPSLAKAEQLSKSMERNELAGETLALADEELIPKTSALATEAQSSKENTPAFNNSHVAVVHKVAKGLKFSSPAAKVKTKDIAKNIKATKPLAKTINKPLAKNTLGTSFKKAYAIQLATFSQQHNADILITRLKAKGYPATFTKVKTNDGFVFKVMVGQVNKNEQAQVLQAKLANAVQIKGFIVTTGEG
ncbi:MAG: SPOR domain-containing protein [Tatlockia sp.]|nr:SPOR domain-containing protein [Tatlockia sp.]